MTEIDNFNELLTLMTKSSLSKYQSQSLTFQCLGDNASLSLYQELTTSTTELAI